MLKKPLKNSRQEWLVHMYCNFLISMRCYCGNKCFRFAYWSCATTKDHPIAFLSKTLAQKHHSLSTYENKYLAVTLDKWRGYLLDSHFIIKTYLFSLKYLLDQRITTPTQMKWLPKLMGYDYEIMYKKGYENVVVDALSRVQSCAKLL